MEAQMQSKLSSAQLRKIKKPIIEKRRRERIKGSMDQLKNLLLEALDKDVPSHSKMEQADILELAVNYLRTVKSASVNAKTTEEDALAKYQAGYKSCAQEVGRYLGNLQGAGPDLASRLKNHLCRSKGIINSSSATPSESDVLDATRLSSLPGISRQAVVVPVFAGGHRAKSSGTVMTPRHRLPQIVPCRVVSGLDACRDSIPRNTSPASATEGSQRSSAFQRCGLEASTVIPSAGFCQDFSLIKTHVETPLWRPW